MLITSRDGLYIFKNDSLKLLRDIKCFGICNYPNNIYFIFHFLGPKNKNTKKGRISRFIIKDENIIEEKEIIDGLDNGIHEITSTGKDIIILQTYFQNIIKYELDENFFPILETKKVIQIDKFVPCYNINYLDEKIHKYDDFLLTERNYQHFNSITIQDNFIYLLAPRLRNVRINGKNTQNENFSTIFVFDINFKFIYQVGLQDYFCHSLVIKGSKIYYLTSFSELKYYDFKDKKTYRVIQYPNNKSNKTNLTRGLSIINNTFYFGSQYEDIDKKVLVEYENGIINEYELPDNISICYITNLIFGKDYNHVLGDYKKSFVLKYPIKQTKLSDYLNDFINIKNLVGEEKIPLNDIHKKRYEVEHFLEDLKDILNPKEIIFKNPLKRQHMVQEKSLIRLTNHNNFKLTEINLLEQKMLNLGFNFTGNFYLYKPNTGLGWHTNLESNEFNFRCYMVFTDSEDSWFMYKHPISKQIHFIKDIDQTCNIFHLGTIESPLWHSVINLGETNRLSVGLGVNVNELKYLGIKNFMDIIH